MGQIVNFNHKVELKQNKYKVENLIPSFRKESEKVERLNPDLIPYIDVDSPFPFIKHPLLWTELLDHPKNISYTNYSTNQIYIKNKKLYDDYLQLKKYDSVIRLISKPLRINWFYDNRQKIYKEMGEDKYYSILREILVEIEFHYYNKEYYSKLLYVGDPLKMMDDDEKISYDELPENIKIYRGVNDDNNCINKSNFRKFVGHSWSIDKEISIWFSKRFNLKSKVVLSIEISKDQVLSYFSGMGEQEILVDYSKLDYSKIKIEILK
jgi:hypothetical protein